MKIKNIVELRELSWPIHDWLKKHNPDLLYSVFPNNKMKRDIDKREIELALEKKEIIRINHRLFARMQTIFNTEPDWKAYIIQKYPENFRNQTFYRMISLMPGNVLFKEGQGWRGVGRKYTFIHSEYGEFIAEADKLMYRSWPEGRSGHPKEGCELRRLRRSRMVKNLDTGEVYDSMKSAAKSVNVTRSNLGKAIKSNKRTFGGYRWAYCDENGSVIDSSKEDKK